MNSISPAVRVICLLTLVWAAVAQAQPNPYSTVTTNLTCLASVVNCPAGDGDPLAAAWCCVFPTPNRIQVDATITLNLRDINDVPVPNFPREDMWLEADGACFWPGGNIADHDTDIQGLTTFSGPFLGGGCSQDYSTRVLVNGVIIISPPLDIWFNSPDLNCDGVVNLIDFVLFVPLYLSNPYDYCIDLHYDCDEGLSDLVAFVMHFGHVCP